MTRRQGVVEEHGHPARVHHRHVGEAGLRPVARPDHGELARPQADRPQTERQVPHALARLPVGQRPPLAPLLPAERRHAGVVSRGLREGGQQRAARDLGLDRIPLRADRDPPGLVSRCHRHALTIGRAAAGRPPTAP
jgi:hypothetical protein